jgi:hypothetical protein
MNVTYLTPPRSGLIFASRSGYYSQSADAARLLRRVHLDHRLTNTP